MKFVRETFYEFSFRLKQIELVFSPRGTQTIIVVPSKFEELDVLFDLMLKWNVWSKNDENLCIPSEYSFKTLNLYYSSLK